MPELKGFEEKDGKVYAVIHYPNARTFKLQPAKSATSSAALHPNKHEDRK
jgi:hypothetical protein